MGNAESQPVRNVDKRTARRDHAHVFNGAITRYRQEHGIGSGELDDEEVEPFHESGDALRVAVRRRPFFKHEKEQGEFDVVSCRRRSIVVHDCRLYPDCRRLYIAHNTFRFDRVYDEGASSADVYGESVAPLVHRATTSRPSTVLMYGQTGSGKTYTMRAIFAAAAHDIFKWIDTEAGDYVTVAYAELGGSGARDMVRSTAPHPGLHRPARGPVHTLPPSLPRP